MDIVLKKETTFIFRTTSEDATSNFLWNTTNQTTCYPIVHHISFIHNSENLKQNKQWIVHARKTELKVPHYVLNQHCMM